MPQRHVFFILTASLLTSVLSLGVAAQARAADSPQGWSGSAELGGAVTTGNSRTSNLDAKLKLGFVSGPWDTQAHIETLRATSSGQTTANRTAAEAGTHYALDATNYAFAHLRDTRDSFSGFRYQASVSAGLGHLLLNTPDVRLLAEIGPGYRQSALVGDGTQKNAIVRAHGAFTYHFSAHAKFKQTLTAIAGRDGTELESVTGLSTAITGSTSLKIAYTVLHNTQVPLGRKKTDTFTTINLVYAF